MPNHIFQLPDASQQPLITLPITGCSNPQIAQQFGKYFGAEMMQRSPGGVAVLAFGAGYLMYKAARKYGPAVLKWRQEQNKTEKKNTPEDIYNDIQGHEYEPIDW